MTLLVKDFQYNVPVAEVWNALTTTDKMKEWYFPQLRKFEPAVGFRFEFTDDNQEYQKDWIVTEVIEGKRLAHSWAYKGFDGISEVRFDLFSYEGHTRLQLTHTGIENFPVHPHFNRERFDRGWNNLLGQNLKRLLDRTKS
jgi:uncharacterized protein YndB with AHSA1/START domain